MTAMRPVLFPLAAFLLVGVAHFVWVGAFPVHDAVQNRWAPIEADAQDSWVARYVDSGGYWLGFSYAYPAAFAASAFRRYLERRRRADRAFAVGGITVSGILAAAGCFLTGCCGSPMLGVYLNLFGASFLPFAKPLMAGITFLFVSLSWVWMVRRPGNAENASPKTESCADPHCACK